MIASDKTCRLGGSAAGPKIVPTRASQMGNKKQKQNGNGDEIRIKIMNSEGNGNDGNG